MNWEHRGKYQGKNVNDLPDSYVQWAIENASGDMKADAQRIKDFRKNKGMWGQSDSGGRTTRSSGARKTDPTTLRYKILDLSIKMDTKNPWQYVEAVGDYLTQGKKPDFAKEPMPEPKVQEDFDPENPFEPEEDTPIAY